MVRYLFFSRKNRIRQLVWLDGFERLKNPVTVAPRATLSSPRYAD